MNCPFILSTATRLLERRMAFVTLMVGLLAVPLTVRADVYIGDAMLTTGTYTLPSSVSRIVVELRGTGGTGMEWDGSNYAGGAGGLATASYAVTGGQVLQIGSSISIIGGFSIFAEDGTSAYEEDGNVYIGSPGEAGFDSGHGYVANSGSATTGGAENGGQDGPGGSGSTVIRLYTNQPPSITSALTANRITGNSYSYQITASNAPTSYGVSGLPSGLTFNASTGQITGSIASAGTYSFVVTATNANGTGQATVTWTFANAQRTQILSAQGTIISEDDGEGGHHGSYDYYSLAMPAAGIAKVSIVATLSGQGDDVPGLQVDVWDQASNWSAENGTNFTLYFDLSSGSHMISVHGNTDTVSGDYAITAEFIPTNGALQFTSQPQWAWALTGTNLSFTAVANDASATYRWQRQAATTGVSSNGWMDIFDGGDFSGTGTTTLHVVVPDNLSGYMFRCTAATATAWAVSSVAGPMPGSLPRFTAQPAGATIPTYNGVPSAYTLTAAAVGEPAPTYQWFRWSNGSFQPVASDGINYSGATSPTLTVLPAAPQINPLFRCVATNAVGSRDSDTAIISYHEMVTPPVFFVDLPGSDNPVDVNVGGVASFIALASGGLPMSYRWQCWGSTGWADMHDDIHCLGTGSSNLSIWNVPIEFNNLQIRCVATNSAGATPSKIAILRVTGIFGYTTQPQSRSVTPGGSTDFTAIAVCSDGPVVYRWQRFASGDWQDLGVEDHYSGVTTTKLTVSNVEQSMNGTRLRCRAFCGTRALASDEVTLTVDSSAPRSSQAINFPAIANQAANHPPFTLIATATSGLPVTYSIVSGNVSLSGNTVTILNVGDVTIRASQAGNTNYLPAPDVERSFSIVSTAEGAPIANKATQVAPTQFVANWSSVNSATGYLLEIATNGSFTNPITRFVSGTAYLVNNVSPLAETIVRPALTTQAYYYRVRAQTTAGTSPYSNVISVGPLGFLQSASDSAWLSGIPLYWTTDTNNNLVPHYSGLIDEVIPVGTDAGFNYFISDWSYYNPNNSVVFDSDWPLNEWWDPDTVDLNENGNRQPYSTSEWIDGFTFYGDPQWFKFYVAAEFKAEANYTYDIAYSTADELTGDNLGAGIQPGGHLLSFPADGWRLISLTNPFNRDELNHARFYLIRRAQAFASTTLSIGGTTIGIGASGSSAGPIAVPGIGTVNIGSNTTSVTLPDGTVITVDRNTGQVLKNGNPIPIGETTVAGIGIKIDSTGGELSIPGGPTVHVNPNGSGAITLPGGAGISVSSTGAVSVNLPPTVDPAIVRAVDILGKILQANKGVKISVIDVLGVLGKGAGAPVAFPSSGVIQDILIGTGKNGGVFQVGVQIDDAHTFWFTVNLFSAPKIAVDANRDGAIAFDASDATAQNAPYRFWINDDDDDPDGSENVPVIAQNWLNNKIDGIRDLEDFTRLKIDLSGLQEAVLLEQVRIGLKWKGGDSPGINVWRNLSPNGSTAYLTDMNVAKQHLALRDPGTIQGALNYIIPREYWIDVGLSSSQPYGHLLFEGISYGKGQLVVTLYNSAGYEIAEGGSVWIELLNIKSMYQRAKATADGTIAANGIDCTIPLPRDFSGPDSNNIPHPNMGWSPNDLGYPFQPDPAEDMQHKTYIVFVHGWRQSPDRAAMFAETMFKRLWHHGYKGRFAAFRWPTYYDNVPAGIFTYNDSEYRAWKSGESLKQYVSSLPSGYVRDIIAHSMGNTVAGSALERGMSASNYAILNGAVPAMCFDEDPSLRQWPYITPNDDPDPAIKTLAYIGRLKTLSTNAVNFYLSADSATVFDWETNNYGFKPQGLYAYKYSAPAGQRLLLLDTNSAKNRSLVDPHEAMSLAVQSLTKTVGGDGRTRGSIRASVNLDTWSFGTQHSAEFERSAQETWDFYSRLLLELQILP